MVSARPLAPGGFLAILYDKHYIKVVPLFLMSSLSLIMGPEA
jgi:hypothetical protein